jgi:hypothetical protein
MVEPRGTFPCKARLVVVVQVRPDRQILATMAARVVRVLRGLTA